MRNLAENVLNGLMGFLIRRTAAYAFAQPRRPWWFMLLCRVDLELFGKPLILKEAS